MVRSDYTVLHRERDGTPRISHAQLLLKIPSPSLATSAIDIMCIIFHLNQVSQKIMTLFV